MAGSLCMTEGRSLADLEGSRAATCRTLAAHNPGNAAQRGALPRIATFRQDNDASMFDKRLM